MWLVESWSGMDIANCVSEGGEEGAGGWDGLPVACQLPLSSPFSLLYPAYFLEVLCYAAWGSPQVSQALSSARPRWEALDSMEGRGRKWAV